MGKKIYVGNLSYTVEPSTLEGWFAEFGPVESCKVISDRDTGKSKGFGFVEMENADEANKAVSELNGQEKEGRNLRVDFARETAPQNYFSGGRGRFY